MNKTYMLKELTQTWFASDSTVVRCVYCRSPITKPDDDCPVCRVIKHIKNDKNPKKGVNK